mmetsp:Transcript_25746/g.60139  ORF Transcript_25746/g.60139 Transcript_25746/m.60139 type:complete len:206 (-) Transcript_25746:2347-2964(-)
MALLKAMAAAHAAGVRLLLLVRVGVRVGVGLLVPIAAALRDLARNTVKVHLPHARDHTPALAGLLHDLDLLQLLQNVADDTAGRRAEGVRAGAPVLGATKLALERSDAKTRLEVDFPGDGRCPGVVPVLVVRSELLVAAGLHDVGPLRELELVRVLKVRRIGGDELGRGNVPDGDSARLVLSHCDGGVLIDGWWWRRWWGAPGRP